MAAFVIIVIVIPVILVIVIRIFTVANVAGVIPPPTPAAIFYDHLFFEEARAPADSATADVRDCPRVMIMRLNDCIVERLYE